MSAHISTLSIPTNDPQFAVRIYEQLFDTRLTAQHHPDPQQLALLTDALPYDGERSAVTHFLDSDGNLVALRACA